MRRSCSGQCSPVRSMSRCVIGSWPRHTATRWRCLSCPVAGRPPSSRGGSACPAARRCRDGSSRATGSGWGGRPPPPPSPRLLLLVGAAERAGDPVLVLRAAAGLGIGPDAAASAASVGLVAFGAQGRFSHPLVRSAVYRAGTPEERRRVHHALAEATDADADPDRRAWHCAQAVAGLDEEGAAMLERSAGV